MDSENVEEGAQAGPTRSEMRKIISALVLPAIVAKAPLMAVKDSGRLSYLHEEVTEREAEGIRLGAAILAVQYADALLRALEE